MPSPTVHDREQAAAHPASAARDAACADVSARVRRVAAGRSDLSLGQQLQLSHDADRQVRRRLAENPACRPTVLVALSDDPDFHVRWLAVQHPAADEQVYEHVLSVGDKDAMWALAQTPTRLNSSLLEQLMTWPDSQIRQQLVSVTTNGALLERLAGDTHVGVRAHVAANPFTPLEAVDRLVRDPQAVVRVATAGRADLSDDQIEVLVRDRSSNVRWSLALHQGGRVDALRRLAQDDDQGVAERARQTLDDVQERRVLMLGHVEAVVTLLAYTHNVSTEGAEHFTGLPVSWFVTPDGVPSREAITARVKSLWDTTLSTKEVDLLHRAATAARASIYRDTLEPG